MSKEKDLTASAEKDPEAKVTSADVSDALKRCGRSPEYAKQMTEEEKDSLVEMHRVHPDGPFMFDKAADAVFKNVEERLMKEKSQDPPLDPNAKK
jgi:hypothetical protein